MRLLPTVLLPLLVSALMAPAGLAQAQRTAGNGTYTSTFEVVVDNCDGAGASLKSAPVTVNQAGPVLTIKIPTVPDMKGEPGKRGKLRAVATSEDAATKERSKFAFNGKFTSKKLKAVLVAEYFSGDKPLCTQSWSVTGTPAAR